ncbi:MAG: class 1 fructose-bisphosphatase [Bacteroidota bacterium]|nr:class 1 fructose-bisphosphatase [Bacteroidota bacterium]MEC8032433.1 class 1 fructose-bisphosphatase [Bacteroidota bacterium]MEC8835641.1 class 1 fructose-bisphosphatase [Bacteroidota bacterium]MEC9221385.1 class 1 fructose-bisphosphatase [Bacteroidota bacterium]
MHQVVTLSQFIAEEQAKHPESSGNLSRIFRDIKLAAKIVNRDVRKAGLVDILGEHGTMNIQGEEVKKLDVIANDIFIDSLSQSGDICAILSEEEDDFRPVNTPAGKQGKYVIAIDPMDGSSNIDANVTIGTIFSIWKRKSPLGSEVTLDDCLQAGSKQVAAGYVVYGSSTMLVYTTGSGVNGFTLDVSIGDFCLSHPNMTTPSMGQICSINSGNYRSFSEGMQEYIDYTNNKGYTGRYIGSFVADFHRNMVKGGIYLYPATEKAPNGKLRLLYECNPMAFLIEQAGGIATTGEIRVLDIQPAELHQRIPLIIGSKDMVEEALRIAHPNR